MGLMLCRAWWFFFFFKQKTAYEMRISDWSSDVCSSDLKRARIDDIIAAAGVARGTFYNYYTSIEELLDDLWERVGKEPFKRIQSATHNLSDPAERLAAEARLVLDMAQRNQIGRASCRERACQCWSISGVAELVKKKTSTI